MDDKTASAYHEAGHCIQALEFDKHSFVSARIVEFKGRWEGDTNINVRDISELDRVNIALAGVAAEALAVAKAADKAHILDETAYDPMKAIADIICFHFYVDMSPVWKAELVAGGHRFPANISRKDIENIPPGYRNTDLIIGTLLEVCRFFNKDAPWQRTEKLAKAIYGNAPNPVGQFHLFTL